VSESWDSTKAPGARMSIGIALQLYTLREQAGEDFVGMLKGVAAAGYGAIEFAGYGGLEPPVLWAIVDDLGLRAISSHVPFQRMETEPDTVLEELRVLGCIYAVVPGIPKEMRGIESAPYLIENFNKWGAASKAAGLRFGYHNHGWELEPVDGSTMLGLFAERTDPTLVDLQIDIYWALVGGADPLLLIRQLAGRVPTLHAKELATGADRKDTTIGDGATPWPELIAAAKAAGTEWFIVEQEDDPAHAYRDIRRSLANLQRLLAESEITAAG
jgi:sugar phosphate isomerase/epimerase